MRFLRRSTPTTVGGTPDPADAAHGANAPARSAGKGRPTPKRRESEAKRRGPAPPPPRTQREASKLARANRPPKADRRAAAAERRERMAAGDDKFLLPRDRGPVKAYVRDVVDSRPHLMGLFMPLAVLVLLSVLVPVMAIQQYLSLFSIIVLLSMITEGVLLGMSTARKASARFPDAKISALGIGWYTFTRASQLRRMRIPKPRVARGANP